ncbi:MAG: FdrA family protein, partial [Anaerolineae bacterium]|nr:FdrA family protein [Anaerolineae bacterium]
MSVTEFEIRKGAYYDSVVLMRLQRDLADLPDVIDAGVVMATAANRDLLSVNDLLPDSMSASPDDLLIVVKADTKKSASNALGNVDELLARRKSSA